jgi:hypothetical protein
MKILRNLIASIAVIAGLAFVAVPAGAVDVFSGACSGATSSTVVCKSTTTDTSVSTVIKNVINTLLYLLGAAAVIVIVIAGILYVTSGGETAGVTRAKNMLLYAVVGLVIALLAYAIVNFVISRFITK